MVQVARNLTDTEEPFLRRASFLIMDRDTKYSAAFRAALTRERIEPIRLSPHSPNLNAYAEGFVRSVKTECTGRMIFFSRSSLERARTHYYEERNHQGLKNRLLKCSHGSVDLRVRVARRERLGGMLNFYYREAA